MLIFVVNFPKNKDFLLLELKLCSGKEFILKHAPFSLTQILNVNKKEFCQQKKKRKRKSIGILRRSKINVIRLAPTLLQKISIYESFLVFLFCIKKASSLFLSLCKYFDKNRNP